MVHVFYPRDPTVAGQRAEYLPDAVTLRGIWGDAIAARIEAMRSYSYAGAPLANGTRRYPVAVFLPGGGMKALLNHALIEDLASHGWIVAAVDPPYNAPAIRFPDGRVIGSIPDSDKAWPKEMVMMRSQRLRRCANGCECSSMPRFAVPKTAFIA